MKKKVLAGIMIAVVLAILFVPMPIGPCKDGGTRQYSALTYKIVAWHRLHDDGIYKATKAYWFPDNFKSVDALWAYEEDNVTRSFVAEILKLDASGALVQPAQGEQELFSSDQIYIGTAHLEDIGAEVGSRVKIYYTGGIMESYPARVHAVKWALAENR
jgi:hypothetical protein